MMQTSPLGEHVARADSNSYRELKIVKLDVIYVLLACLPIIEVEDLRSRWYGTE